jgi:hypothetical protein
MDILDLDLQDHENYTFIDLTIQSYKKINKVDFQP